MHSGGLRTPFLEDDTGTVHLPRRPKNHHWVEQTVGAQHHPANWSPSKVQYDP